MLAPVGTVHTYEVAPVTVATEYVSSFIVPTETQIAAVPVIVPGVAGKATTVTVI